MVHCQWNYVHLSVTCGIYTVPLQHLLPCSEYCRYDYFCLNWETGNMRVDQIILYCKVCGKRLNFDSICTYKTTGRWQPTYAVNGPLIHSNQFHTYIYVYYNLSLGYSAFAEELEHCWLDDHCNSEVYWYICFGQSTLSHCCPTASAHFY